MTKDERRDRFVGAMLLLGYGTPLALTRLWGACYKHRKILFGGTATS